MNLKNFKYKEELKVITKIVKDVYKKVISRIKFDTKVKGISDLVTDADLKAEVYIADNIKKHFPDDIIVGEEYSPRVSFGERTWTIDPIDGTINFANNIPLWGIQVSFSDCEDSQIGVIYLPKLNEFYVGLSGFGSYLNGKRLPLIDKSQAGEYCLSDTTDVRVNLPDLYKKQMQIIDVLNKNSLRVRSFGASSVDLSFLASGRLSCVVMVANTIWDIIPGLVLCREVGVDVITDSTHKQKIIYYIANNDLKAKLKIDHLNKDTPKLFRL